MSMQSYRWLRARRARTGFTIVEMLIVVAIIGILMALLLPALAAIMKAGRVKATRTLINGISAGLTRYYQDFQEFPPSTADTTNSFYAYLCGPTGNGFTITKTVSGLPPMVHHYDPYVNIPPESCRRNGPLVVVVDAWGSPIVYYNCKFVVDTTPALANTCYNPNSFDIFSKGPDRVRDPNNKIGVGAAVPAAPVLVDDITNIPGQQ